VRLGRPLPWHEAAHLLIPIACALEYAHSQGMVHRDVKPSNILLSSSGVPILADFGIAKVLQNKIGSAAGQSAPSDLPTSTDSDLVKLTRTDVGIGTPEYMAPEQGRGQTDYRSDIYSLGVVFYEMVTGRKPFVADTPLAVLLMHITDPLPSPLKFAPDLPIEIERIIIKALAKRPEDRYQSMVAFSEAISQRLTSYEEKLRSLAASLEKDEKWPEALQVWRAVLALEPADRQAIEAKNEHIQHMGELGSVYTEARQALAKKDYDRTIKLLKEIVARDQSYKDAVTLLTRIIKIRHSLADDLEGKEKWDEAINAWRGYLALEPENKQDIEAAIHRIERKRDLDYLYKEARQALENKDSDRAIKVLKEIVTLDQSYKDANALLTHTCKTRHALADSLEGKEKWDEAIDAWRGYLALEPENQPDIEAAIQRIERKRELENLYKQARRAINNKDYDLAVRHLKDIVARDEMYKDVLQLLTQVTAKRSAVQRQIHQRRTWITLGLISAIIMLSLGAGYALANWQGLKRAFPFLAAVGNATPSLTPVPTIGTASLTSTAGGNAIQPLTPGTITDLSEKIRLFSDPILAAIANKTPDYRDDFIDPKSGWPNEFNGSINEKGYKDGAYFISNFQAEKGGDCNGSAPFSSPVFTDFVLEVDLRFINQGNGAAHVLFRSNNTSHYGVNLSPEGRLWFHKNVNGIHVALPQTEIPISSFRSGEAFNHLTLIARGNQMAAYINGEPVSILTDSSSSQGTFLLGVCSDTALQVLFDNLKVWDVSGITVETSPGVIRLFADPFLASIAKRSPDLQEDFSDPKSGWPAGSTANGDQWGYLGGTYALTVSRTYHNEIGDPCMDLAYNFSPQFTDFILEFDAQFVSGKGGNWHTSFRATPASNSTSDVIVFNIDGSYYFSKSRDDQTIYSQQWPPAPSFIEGQVANRLTIIARGTRTAIYLNGEPLILVNDINWENGAIALSFGACNIQEADSPLQVRFDNLKIWDVSALEH
jgi:tetratricopeptide (TPR) repeat protein